MKITRTYTRRTPTKEERQEFRVFCDEWNAQHLGGHQGVVPRVYDSALPLVPTAIHKGINDFPSPCEVCVHGSFNELCHLRHLCLSKMYTSWRGMFGMMRDSSARKALKEFGVRVKRKK
jgi:hypothetical protein